MVIVSDSHQCKDTATYQIGEPEELKVNLGDDAVICPNNIHVFDGGEYATCLWTKTTTGAEIETARFLATGEEGTYAIKVTKVLGEYDNMTVNTDGVIIGEYTWKSVQSDYLLANPEAIEQWADETALNIAGATYNNTIKDTIRLSDISFETISREGDRYFALTTDGTREEITSAINGTSRALVQDSEGHELVIDKDGEPMGVAEYRACGGSKKLMDDYNAHRDSMMTTKGNVTFSKFESETYGFDCWRGEDYDKEQYPDFNGYRPAYICVEKGKEIKIGASQTNGITFKTERGVPLIIEGGAIKYSTNTTGDHAVYAYCDTALAGKLCVKTFDVKEAKVHLVRVNGNAALDLDKITAEVNKIYNSAVVHYTIDELEPIKIEYANKKNFVHGGKGSFQNYNADQKTAIKALPQSVDPNDYYLFFVECYDRLDTAGNKSNEVVSGYMPVGRHYGFIYNEYNNARTIAHELGHGTNALHHTFAEGSESFVTTATTDNLMDYHGGTRLNHRQWQWAHEKHRNVLGFLDEEGESEIRETTSIKWVGDWFEGYIYDKLEKAVESQLSIFDKIASNYSAYYEKSKKEDLQIDALWSVRASAHKDDICGRIFEKISKKETPQFSLHTNGIYTNKYTLEGKAYNVAVLSCADKFSLEAKKIKLASYSKLADSEYVKAGYTKRSGGYGVIAFYDEGRSVMMIQIVDSEPRQAVEKWLNYLSLILPSKEQEDADGENIARVELHLIDRLIEIWNAYFRSEGFKTLEQAEELTPKEIREYRNYIKALPEEERADWYLELQKKVPYHNQRDNESLATEVDIDKNKWLKDGEAIGDIMCNLTSEAMCLEMLGIEFPCGEYDSNCVEYGQFEDYLECLRLSKKYGHRGECRTRKELATLLGVQQKWVKVNSNKIDVIERLLSEALKDGRSILISASFGHIVRLQAITNEGLVVDDPYGKVYDFSKSGATPKYYIKNAYDQRNGNRLGADNLWTWSELKSNKITIKYAEIYSIDD